MGRTLPEGLYEHLVTGILDADLRQAAPLQFDLGTIDDIDLAPFLVRHLSAEIDRALRQVKTGAKQLEVADAILACLDKFTPESDSTKDAAIAAPPRLLRAFYRTTRPARPATPLSSSTLLTRTRNEPALGHELALEIASADGIDILSAFITMGGVRAVREALEGAVRRGTRIRVLSTVFTGTTEVGAIDALARLPGASVRISYDVRRTRLHAKAWLFRRRTELHTAYVGSANLTATALGSGQEWMVKICAADLPHLIAKFEGTFESLWNDDEFEPYDSDSESARDRLRNALGAENSRSDSTVLALFTLRPHPFQEAILDRLAAERSLHGRMRNLLVAATGTGKTVIAAFDYLRTCERTGTRPRLLFLAHRREILDQARATFRQVLRDHAFGERYLDGEIPSRWEHVFASIQTAATGLAERVANDHFQFVIVDECHHAPAESYQRAIRFLAPAILLGLTATPERSDGKSLLPDFDGRIAVELRLWHALEHQLLAPFEYYGIADGTDLTALRWSRQGYAAADLARVYTGHEKRVDLVLAQLKRRVADLGRVRAIAFCVSVEHADFMARALSERGVAALAVHGQSPEADRADAPQRLRARDVNVICTCDLYNEGVDLPFVDTLLLLRPTSSATLFLQQIGRGLRIDSGKTSCLVLDFIGQHRAEFRFDALYASLTGIPRAKLLRAVDEGFPYLPAGCLFQLDDEVSAQVIRTLRATVANAAMLAHELRQLSSDGPDVTLARYLEESGRDVEDVYAVGGWTSVRSKAGLCDEVAEASDLSRRLGWLLHTDEPSRLRLWEAPTEASHGASVDRRRLTMLDFQLNPRGLIRQPAETAEWLARHEPIRKELRELGEVLGERVPLAEELYPVPEWPLAIHRHYTRREICAGVGSVKPGEKGSIPQGGILKLEAEKRELLLVTLEKSAKSFSPTTRYRDYAISARRFHWETQTAASVSRPSGRRYLDSPENGWTFYLFVRADTESAYAFLGRAMFVSAAGDRPIGITWELEQPMPGALFDRFASLAQG